MNAIVKFFEGIGLAISSAFDFLISIVQDLVYLVKSIGWAVAQIPNLLSWLPSKFLATITVLITIIVVCRIIGRD